MLKAFFVLVLCIGLLVPQGLAADVWEMAESESYKQKTGGMLGRGLINAATSPVDIIVQTVNKTKSGPPLIGTLTGLGGGLGCTALRAGSGILDVALFWVPGFNGFPVARSYDNCLCWEEREAYTAAAPVYVAPVYTAPMVQTPVPVVTQSVAPAPIVTIVEPAAPVATVTEPEPEPVATPKRLVREHSAYDYVKK